MRVQVSPGVVVALCVFPLLCDGCREVYCNLMDVGRTVQYMSAVCVVAVWWVGRCGQLVSVLL